MQKIRYLKILTVYLFKKDTSIFGYRLDTDPEEREFYVNCSNCGHLVLDNGLSKHIKYNYIKKM